MTRYAYDALNRLISETQDEGGLNLTTTYRYDRNGNLVRIVDPRGVVTLNTYDALGRLVSTRRDAEGLNLETTFDYDQAGNLGRITDPRGPVTTYEYDELTRRKAQHEDATGLDLITRYTYDRLGNQTFVTDANGIISLIDSNAFGKPVRSVQDVDGIEAETRYVYDNNLNLIAITDDNGNTTQYTYDKRDQRREIRYADGTTVGYTYTPLGGLDTRTNQAGEQVDFDYDAIERLTNKSYPDGSSQSFTYNAAGRLTIAQQQMSGHTTNVSFDYDPLGSVQEHMQTVDGLNWTTSYSYDYTAGTASTTYPSGTQVVKSLDTLSRLSQVQQDSAPVAGYSYNVTAGTVTQIHGNGLSTLVETDPLWRVTRLSSTVADYRYGYDNVGNRMYMQRAHKSGAPADVYTYDNLYQLTQVWYGADATEPGGISAYDSLQAYTLDPVGNRLEVENDGTSVSYLPNDGQKLTNPMHRYEQVNGQVLGYDLKGNLLDDGNNTYTYDVQNQQIGMSGPNGTAEYVYDALGRRVAKIVDGVTTYYVYNAFYQVLEERDGGNQLLARYTYGAGIDAVLTMERGGTTYTYHRDALGSITEVTDTGGSLVERYEYDVYGTATIFDDSGTPLTVSAIDNLYLFTARRYDPESGNDYYRARIYSPSLGRFLQMDPLGYVDGMNLYEYAENNPVNFVDSLDLVPYPKWVEEKLRKIIPLIKSIKMKKKSDPSEEISDECYTLLRAIALKFIADEYSSREGFKGIYDWFQDGFAGSGLHMVPETQGWVGWVDESWKRGNFFEKAVLTPLHAGYNDLGPANIQLNAALQILGKDFETTSSETINALAKELTTDEGTAKFAIRFAIEAVMDLKGHFCNCTYRRKRVEITVTRIREGAEHFWNRIGRSPKRKLTPQQIQQWRKNPNSFPNVLPLDPGKLDDDKFRLIERLIQ